MKYMKQELILGRENQKKLKNKKVCVVGIGGLGGLTSELLIRVGIGRLILIDRDFVEEDNLQRQVLFDEDDIGKSKALIAKEKLSKINKEIAVEAYFDNLDSENINILESDLVIDCTDNLNTRYLINDFCVKNKIPFIYGAAIMNKGYLFNVIPEGPCLKCVLNNSRSFETCDTVGVLNSITSLISCLQVNEAIKILIGKEFEKNLLFIDLDKNRFEKIKVRKRKDCKSCNSIFENLDKKEEIVKFCGSSRFLFRRKYDFKLVKEKLKKFGIKDLGDVFYFENFVFFKDKVLIKAKGEKEARSLYSKFVGD